MTLLQYFTMIKNNIWFTVKALTGSGTFYFESDNGLRLKSRYSLMISLISAHCDAFTVIRMIV